MPTVNACETATGTLVLISQSYSSFQQHTVKVWVMEKMEMRTELKPEVLQSDDECSKQSCPVKRMSKM